MFKYLKYMIPFLGLFYCFKQDYEGMDETEKRIKEVALLYQAIYMSIVLMSLFGETRY